MLTIVSFFRLLLRSLLLTHFGETPEVEFCVHPYINIARRNTKEEKKVISFSFSLWPAFGLGNLGVDFVSLKILPGAVPVQNIFPFDKQIQIKFFRAAIYLQIQKVHNVFMLSPANAICIAC